MEKKLYKIEQGKKLDGVCGGIAEYFNVDPTLIRLVWALVTLCTVGVGLIGYLICAVIMPRKSEVVGYCHLYIIKECKSC